jgi:hypothetical protein
VVPLYIAFMGLAGIKPLEPGFARVEVRPQVAELDQLELTAFTGRGPIHFRSQGHMGSRELTLELPKGCEGELVLTEKESVKLAPLHRPAPAGPQRYELPAGQTISIKLQYT